MPEQLPSHFIDLVQDALLNLPGSPVLCTGRNGSPEQSGGFFSPGVRKPRPLGGVIH